MELRPADLGDAYQSTIVLKRARGKPTSESREARRHVNPWVRRSTASLNLPDSVQKETLGGVSDSTRTVPLAVGIVCSVIIAATFGLPFPPEAHLALIAAPAAAGTLAGLVLRREAVREIYNRPLREADIAHLRPIPVKDPTSNWLDTHVPLFLRDMLPPKPAINTAATLETDYFDLVASILRLPEPEKCVKDELRETIRQIGDAVAAIKRSEIEEERTDARDLIGDAEMLAARARREPDRVVAGSFLRQARAKVAQAKVVDGNVMLRRRTRALDAELRAQIAATRSTLRNLSSQGTMSLESNGSFRSIADSVRTLATEATSVNAARDELAAALRGESLRGEQVSTPASQVAQAPQLSTVVRQTEVETPVTLRNGRGG